MPISRRAILRAVLAHRGYDHPVHQQEVSQPERREQGRWGRVARHVHAALLDRPCGEPAVHALDELRIAQLQVVVGDSQAAGEQVEGELQRLEGQIALGVLEPLRSEEHTSELQSQSNLVCRLLLEKKKKTQTSCVLSAVTASTTDIY